MQTGIHDLSTIDAPYQIFGQRDISTGTTVHAEAFWGRYDCETLIYDSVWLPQQKKMRLFMPKLLNFKNKLLNASFFSDARSIKPRLYQFRRFDILEWPSESAPLKVHFLVNDFKVDVPVSPASYGHFKDLNVIYTMLRNDDLAWVYDWVLAHQRNHGANGVLVADNGSTAYSKTDLLHTILSVPGIKSAHVLDVPLPYGPPDNSYSAPIGLNFLQTACLNIVRDRFLKHARAVLVCDVDEIVYSADSQSIFDATACSFTKYGLITGSWRFSSSNKNPPQHIDHIMVDRSQKRCQPKYCIVPNSLLGRMCWSVHSLENVNRRIFVPNNKFRFFHCHSISTSWKTKRDSTIHSPDVVIDVPTQEFLNRTFNEA